MFGGFVGHKTIDEGPGSRLSDHTAKGSIEKVRILRDGLLEAGGAIGRQDRKIDRVAVGLAQIIKGLELREAKEVVISTVNKKGEIPLARFWYIQEARKIDGGARRERALLERRNFEQPEDGLSKSHVLRMKRTEGCGSG